MTVSALFAALFLTILIRSMGRPARQECMYCSGGCRWGKDGFVHDNGFVNAGYEPPLSHPAIGEITHPAIPRSFDWRNA